MNTDPLSLVLLDYSNFALRPSEPGEARGEAIDSTRESFEMLSEEGEVVGYIKTWRHDDDYAGFVHFDAQGNILNWNAFDKSNPIDHDLKHFCNELPVSSEG